MQTEKRPSQARMTCLSQAERARTHSIFVVVVVAGEMSVLHYGEHQHVAVADLDVEATTGAAADPGLVVDGSALPSEVGEG